jgi:hypothetical protein
MGFATGPVASDGPLGDSVVRVTPGSGGWGRRGRSRRAQRGLQILSLWPVRTWLGESHGTLPHPTAGEAPADDLTQGAAKPTAVQTPSRTSLGFTLLADASSTPAVRSAAFKVWPKATTALTARDRRACEEQPSRHRPGGSAPPHQRAAPSADGL